MLFTLSPVGPAGEEQHSKEETTEAQQQMLTIYISDPMVGLLQVEANLRCCFGEEWMHLDKALSMPPSVTCLRVGRI
jgi:hypothetical protein